MAEKPKPLAEGASSAGPSSEKAEGVHVPVGPVDQELRWLNVLGQHRGRAADEGSPLASLVLVHLAQHGVVKEFGRAARHRQSPHHQCLVLCGLKSNCSPNAAICCLNGFPRVC